MATKETEAPTSKPSVPQLQLDIQQTLDLSVKVARSTIAVIDTVVQRGAIKGEELSTIGGLRDQAVKITQLIENIEAAKQA